MRGTRFARPVRRAVCSVSANRPSSAAFTASAFGKAFATALSPRVFGDVLIAIWHGCYFHIDSPLVRRQAATRNSAAAVVVTLGPKLSIFAKVALWCAEICAAERTPLSRVVCASETKVTG